MQVVQSTLSPKVKCHGTAPCYKLGCILPQTTTSPRSQTFPEYRIECKKSNLSQATKKPVEGFLYKAVLRGSDLSIFLPLYKVLIHPRPKYALRAASPIPCRDSYALDGVQKLKVKFEKGLRNVPYESEETIRGNLTCKYKTAQDRLDFPWDTVFAVPTHSGLRGRVFKIHQQQYNDPRHQHTFSVRAVPYWNKLPEKIVNASSLLIIQGAIGRTMTAPILGSSPLNPELNSSNHIAPFCHFVTPLVVHSTVS